MLRKARHREKLIHHTRLACVVMACGLLASCTVFWPDSTPLPPELDTQDQIVVAANSIDHSLISLYEIERYKKPENMAVKADPNPEPIYPSLSRHMNVDWSGPIEPLVKEIAMLTNYRLKVIGHEPAIPVLVTIRHPDITAHELLREARAQVYQRADLFIFPDSGIIELHYIDV